MKFPERGERGAGSGDFICIFPSDLPHLPSNNGERAVSLTGDMTESFRIRSVSASESDPEGEPEFNLWGGMLHLGIMGG